MSLMFDNTLDYLGVKDRRDRMFEDYWRMWRDRNGIDYDEDKPTTKQEQNKAYQIKKMKRLKEYSADIVAFAYCWDDRDRDKLRYESNDARRIEQIRELKSQIKAQQELLDKQFVPAPASESIPESIPAPVFQHPEPEPQENFDLDGEATLTNDYSFLDSDDESADSLAVSKVSTPPPPPPDPYEDDPYEDIYAPEPKKETPHEKAERQEREMAEELAWREEQTDGGLKYYQDKREREARDKALASDPYD